MQVRQRPTIARSMLTSQIWLKVGPYYYLLDDPPPGERGEGPTTFGALLAAYASCTLSNLGRIARLGDMGAHGLNVVIRATMGGDEIDGRRMLAAERHMEVGGAMSAVETEDLATAAENCVIDNTMKGMTLFEPVLEMQGLEPERQLYLPPRGAPRNIDTEIHGRGIDDNLLITLRTGGHMLLTDENFTGREKMGAWSVGLMVGSFSADALVNIRRTASDLGLPLQGVEVSSVWHVERELGEGPSFPSSQEEVGTFRGRLANVYPTVKLWGDLDAEAQELLLDAVPNGPVAQTLANVVEITDHLAHVSNK